MVRIGLPLILQRIVKKVETFLRIKQQIEARYAVAAVEIRLDIGSGSVAIAIAIDSNLMLVLYSSAESLKIPDWVKVVRAYDFCFCPNFRKVIAGQQQEIHGFRNCRKFEQIELSRSVEVVGREAFRTDENESGRRAEARRSWAKLGEFASRFSSRSEMSGGC
jgi:hypothetical protein